MEAVTAIDRASITELNSLIKLHVRAIAAYETAIARLENRDYKAKLVEFLQDHRRQVKIFTTTVQRLGGTPSKGSDVRRILAQGKVLLADMLGNDITIMKATKLNEDITNIKYEKALRRCSRELHDLLARHRESEQRHNTWLLSTLASEPQKNTGVPR